MAFDAYTEEETPQQIKRTPPWWLVSWGWGVVSLLFLFESAGRCCTYKGKRAHSQFQTANVTQRFYRIHTKH